MSISAVLLAGGESRRMGRDKATLVLEGGVLWERQLGALRNLHPAELFVSARSDPAWRPRGVRFIGDALPSRGPISGIAASLGQISTAHLLVLAIDMPLMSEEYLDEICRRIEPGGGAVPFIEGRAEPLAAIYPVESRPEFVHALAGADFSLQTLIRRLVEGGKMRKIVVPPKQEILFRNLNNVADVKNGQ